MIFLTYNRFVKTSFVRDLLKAKLRIFIKNFIKSYCVRSMFFKYNGHYKMTIIFYSYFLASVFFGEDFLVTILTSVFSIFLSKVFDFFEDLLSSDS